MDSALLIQKWLVGIIKKGSKMTAEQQKIYESEFTEVPCECGFTSKENRDKFEVFEIEVCTSKIHPLTIFPKKKVLRCKTCKSISILERKEVKIDIQEQG